MKSRYIASMDSRDVDPARYVPPDQRRVLIVGASIRAAAESVHRAGYVPWGADLFADVDQVALAPTIRIEHFPGDFVPALARLPAGPWLYTGGVENDPDLLERLANSRPLLGVDAATVRRVRDPWTLDRVLAPAGFPLPDFHRQLPSTATPSDWLWKPLRSAGGLGLRWAPDARRSDGYFQRYVRGVALGATYLGSSDGVRLEGVTQQLVGPDWGESPGFVYGGSMGPVSFEPRRASQLHELGRVLGESFALVGLFGVDLIDDGHQFWPLEVNPRYTASVEVLEMATGRCLMADHIQACRSLEPDRKSRAGFSPGNPVPLLGKAIVYAQRPLSVTSRIARRFGELHRQQPLRLAADLPQPGSTISAGAPILTVFAEGNSCDSVRATLRERIAEWREE